MIEKPDVPDAVILQALEDLYSIHATGLEFIPLGLDANAWAYHAAAGEHSYFVKVSKETPGEAGALVPLVLSELGFAEVIAPVRTQQGELLGHAGALTLRVQPFVRGERAMDAGMTGHLWAQLGAFLCRLHGLEVPDEVARRVQHETFAARRLEWVQAMQQNVESASPQDAISAELFAFWRARRASIAALIGRTIDARRAVTAAPRPMVFCHGDIHSGNILLGEDGRMYVIDWDDAILAPKERDLMFVLAEVPGSAREDFFASYGSVAIDPAALAYYRHDWCIEDIGAFGQEILDVQARETTRLNSLHWFKTLFDDGGSVPVALAEAVTGLPI